PHGMPIDELLSAGKRRGRQHVKLRLLAAGLKDERCESCGLTVWRDRPLTMALHHVNGDRHDNRLQNLQLLCPNCHSQTDTFGGRNGRSGTAPLTSAPSRASQPDITTPTTRTARAES